MGSRVGVLVARGEGWGAGGGAGSRSSHLPQNVNHTYVVRYYYSFYICYVYVLLLIVMHGWICMHGCPLACCRDVGAKVYAWRRLVCGPACMHLPDAGLSCGPACICLAQACPVVLHAYAWQRPDV